MTSKKSDENKTEEKLKQIEEKIKKLEETQPESPETVTSGPVPWADIGLLRWGICQTARPTARGAGNRYQSLAMQSNTLVFQDEGTGNRYGFWPGI